MAPVRTIAAVALLATAACRGRPAAPAGGHADGPRLDSALAARLCVESDTAAARPRGCELRDQSAPPRVLPRP